MPAITTLADRGEPARTRETIYNLIGSVQFPDMLLELDAATNYSPWAGPTGEFRLTR